jgi:TldD protein
MNIRDTGQELAEIITKYDAEYIEVHLEESQSSHVTYRGKELESIDKTNAVGGNVRALVRGGWGFVSFNNLDNLAGKVEKAVEQASFVSGGDARVGQIQPIVDSVIDKGLPNPVNIPLAEKKQLLDEYNEVIWSIPKLQTSVIGYIDAL